MYNLQPPQSIFVHADGFQAAAIRLQNPGGNPPLNPLHASAVVTNLAFSAELYLKCLIQIETGQMIKSDHDLHKLFLKLPETTRQEIEKPFNAIISKPPAYDVSSLPPDAQAAMLKQPKNLIEALKAGGNAFIEWRYLYEVDESNRNIFSLFPLPAILRDVIIKRKPEWARFGFQIKQIAGMQPVRPAEEASTTDPHKN